MPLHVLIMLGTWRVLGITPVFLVWPHLHKRSGFIAAVLVLVGAFGNLIDRIRLHYVVDYLALPWWPIFNLADSFVVIGIAILLVVTLFTKQDSRISGNGFVFYSFILILARRYCQ